MMNFDECTALFAADRMGKLAATADGLLWLKIKSISRKGILADFSQCADVPLVEGNVLAQFSGLYAELLSRGRKAHDILRDLLQKHLRYTNSPKAKKILANWQNWREKFVKIASHEYARALAEMARKKAA